MRVVVVVVVVVKFAERRMRFWRMNELLDARLLTRRLCGQFRVFCLDSSIFTKFGGRFWRLQSEMYFTTLHSKSVEN